MLLAHLGPHRERRLGKRRGWHYPLSMGEWTEGEISRRKEKKMLAHVFSSCCENIPANQDIVFTNAADEWMLLPRSDVWQPHQLCQTYSKAIFNRLALLSLYYEGDNFLIVNIRCMCRAAASFRFFFFRSRFLESVQRTFIEIHYVWKKTICQLVIRTSL